MPEFMPYTTEKSMIFQVTESWANGSRADALNALWQLVSGVRISDLAPISSANLDGYTGTTAGWRKRHVEQHWWGSVPLPSGGWDRQPPYDPVNNPTTGFWAHWYGDAEAVFRETMVRALCISLGLARTQADELRPMYGRRKTIPVALRGNGNQHWPISIVWKCPCPWYEGWIEFKDYGGARPTAKGGHVTVVLSTPSHGVKLYDTPIRPTNQPPVSNDPWGTYQLNPNQPAGPEGLWVVSQAAHTKIASAPSTKSQAGSWGPPTLGTPVFSAGPVVTVATAVGDGGVAPPGLPLV
ncbi:MAG: hypothetical protein ACJ739_00925 [Acidimicrobiales bacterium]